MINLVPEADRWHQLWSIRLAILASVLGALELSLPLWQGLVPANTFALLSTLAAAGAAAARVIKQNLEGGDA